MPRLLPALVLAVLLPACAASRAPAGPVASPSADSTAAPWSRAPLAATEVPPVYLAAWRSAQNRHTCALLAPASLGRGSGAQPRTAYFSGGWGVAYDFPQLRSAFGVAGTGTSAGAPSYSEWPYRRRWADGSSAGYGPEGGTGPNQLAYLRVQGQDCVYNVWSRLGREHLEQLLEQLRYVQGPE